jgi:CheY-like chemotaxis protein
MLRLGRAVRVLVADDDADNRALLRGYLEHAGFEVEEAADGAEAVAKFARARSRYDFPDVVITDLAMPRCSGLGVLRAIQRIAPGLPVFVVSGSADEQDVAVAYARGALRVMRKPVSLKELASELEAAVLMPRPA